MNYFQSNYVGKLALMNEKIPTLVTFVKSVLYTFLIPLFLNLDV